MTFFGSEGWIEVKENGNVDKGLPSDLTRCDATTARTTRSYAPVNTVRANFEAWAAAVAGEAPYRFSREELLDNVRILDAVVKSSLRDGELIPL
jgi:hypothetical protein